MLIAYHDNPDEKVAILAQLAAHREADELIQGQEYWRDGKGCAVGCTLHSDEHLEYEVRFGIPVMLAHLEDEIFEGLPHGDAQAWPERFMGAIKPGADLSRVGWRLLHWLLTDQEFNPSIKHPLVSDIVKECADVIAPLCDGHHVGENVAGSPARRAGKVARGEGGITTDENEDRASASWSAESAADAAWSVVNAARGDVDQAGVAAAWAARSAATSVAAAWAARRVATSVAASRSAAWEAGESAAWEQIGDKLIEFVECT